MEHNTENNVLGDKETITSLSKGIMEIYEPPLATIKTHLKELTDKQDAVYSMMVSERNRLEELNSNAMADSLLANAAINKERLQNVALLMTGLHKRVVALQARAAKVQEAALNMSSKPKS